MVWRFFKKMRLHLMVAAAETEFCLDSQRTKKGREAIDLRFGMHEFGRQAGQAGERERINLNQHKRRGGEKERKPCIRIVMCVRARREKSSDQQQQEKRGPKNKHYSEGRRKKVSLVSSPFFACCYVVVFPRLLPGTPPPSWC